MRGFLALGLALVLAGCGSTTSTLAAGTTGGQGGSGGSTGDAGGGAGTGGAGGSAGAPAGSLCDEVTVTSWSCTPNNYHDPLVSFVADSSLVFRGTVTALHQTTPGLTISDTSRAIVVHVDAVLHDGGMLGAQGQSVTVLLLAAPTMAVGYEGYFFTQTAELGQSIAVTEVAHVDPGVYPTIESDVPGIEQLLADERLHARMQTAGTVLVGTVTAITSLPATGPFSEHDPVWAEATITADCTLRGATPATARVAFATSDDVAWFASPKLTAGQQGVFLLQPAPSPPGAWAIPDAIPYVATDPLDVHPLADRAHIADLVLCAPSH